MQTYINVTILVTIVTNMITLFKSGYTQIMQLFYKDKTTALHLREVARQTKLHEPSTSKFLNQLEQDKVLKSNKEGNLKKYTIQNNKQTFLFFEYFDLQRLETLPKIRQSAIHTFIQELPEKPIYIILFGSTAKSNFKESSDIDILLITNTTIQIKNAQKEVEALTGITINPLQMTLKEFKLELKLKEDKVVQSAINTGYPIYNNIQFYEALFHERI